jgi:phosphoesterase RecJ-like protein
MTDAQHAAKVIQAAHRLLVLAHVAPDADSLGSALAVAMAATQVNPECHAVVSFGDDPFVVPRMLQTLPANGLLKSPAEAAALGPYDVVVSCDVSSKARLGANEPIFDAAPTTVVIDHHSSNPGFGQLNFIRPEVAANTLLALEVVDALGATVTKDIAHALYAGLITDTGCFKYPATTADTHAVAARLMETGIDHADIARQMYDDEPFAVVQMLGAALGRAQVEPQALNGYGLVLTTVSAADRHSLGLAEDAAERVIDSLRITAEADVAAVLKQSNDGLWKLSLRSKGAVDVSAAARVLGGGGHRYAAGATLGSDEEAAIAAVREALAAAL